MTMWYYLEDGLLANVDGDSEGILFKTNDDRDTISSLGGHNNAQSSVTKACSSSHSYCSPC